MAIGFTIVNGTGDCYAAKVDKDNRLQVQSLSLTNDEYSVLKGNSFGLISGIITLVSDAQRDLIYFKNNGEEDFLQTRILFSCGIPSGTLTGNNWIGRLTLNPTGGSLLSATDGFQFNNNLGSQQKLDTTFKIGDETTNATGLVTAEQLFPANSGEFFFDQEIIIPKGFSIAVGLKPPIGTTSSDVSIGVTIIKQKLDI
jgi:hypothetical protein